MSEVFGPAALAAVRQMKKDLHTKEFANSLSSITDERRLLVRIATLERVVVALVEVLEAKDVVSEADMADVLDCLEIYDQNDDGKIDATDLVAKYDLEESEFINDIARSARLQRQAARRRYRRGPPQ